MKSGLRLAAAACFAAALGFGACRPEGPGYRADRSGPTVEDAAQPAGPDAPAALRPIDERAGASGAGGGVSGQLAAGGRIDKDARLAVPPPDLTEPGVVAWGTTPGVEMDTRTFAEAIQRGGPIGKGGQPRRIREIVPAHDKLPPPPAGEPNELLAGKTLGVTRTVTEQLFPSIDSTGWNPPDPCLAVGPNHVVVTVNQDIAWFTKAGAQQFQTNLGSPGNPGFFEELGAESFCFDPKCFFDQYAQRFVVLALETYRNNEAWITIAVSDDADPNGVWRKYRTDAVLTVGSTTTWWDFPGLGYDEQAYYVTGNLFGLSASGGYGVGVRIFDKAPLLTGSPAVYSTQRLTGVFTVQPALHFGSTPSGVGAYMATILSGTSVRIYAVRNPLTAPTISSTDVTTPAHTGAIEAPTQGGSPVSNAGFTMPCWRNGRLTMVHNASVGGRNVARWHQMNTGSWPVSGGVIRLQSGDIDAGVNLHTIFPAIASNSTGDVGVALGVTGEFSRVGAAVAGRRSADPLGRMGVPQVVKVGESDAGGRWGDYYGIAVDPSDDTTFWGIGEYALSGGGWQNWVSSFRVSDMSLCHPVADDAGVFQGGVTPPATIDVLANDWHSTGAVMTIQSFAPVGTLGGVITRSVGTGPGGRDRLTYAPPSGVNGIETFAYTVADLAGNTASSSVTARVFDPSTFRTPENPTATRAGLNAAYYDLPAGPTALPAFASLTPFSFTLQSSINFPSTNGNFASSGRADNIGAVFEGYFEAPTADLYTFYLNSDDGSRLVLGDSTVIIDNDGTHAMVERSSGPIGLRAGKHKIRIEFFEGGGGAGLIFSVSSPTLAKAPVNATRLSSTRGCPSQLAATVSHAAGGITLNWRPPPYVNPPTLSLLRDGVVIASGLSAATTTFVDMPPLPADKRHIVVSYALAPEGAGAPACGELEARAVISSGRTAFEDAFDAYPDTSALQAAGWTVSNTPAALEAGAAWAIQSGSTRPAPAGFDGLPTTGRWLLSDSDASAGTNPTGSGASHDLISPVFDCSGLSSVVLHFDATSQLNNNGSAVFDIDVAVGGGSSFVNAARRVAPARTSPAPAVSLGNADGQFGRASVNLSLFAAGRSGVRVRLRHFEPTDDWYIGIDNVLVDDVADLNGGSQILLANETFAAGIPATWSVRGLQTGTRTWTTADPCRRSVQANGGAFPRNNGQAVGRLGTQFAIADAQCVGAAPMNEVLVTPPINCANIDRVFLHLRSEAMMSPGARAEVLVSLDGGATFLPRPVFTYNGGALGQPGEDPYYDVKALHVPAAARQGRVAFGFRYISSGAGNLWWAIDDVRVTGDPRRCPPDFSGDGVLDPDDLSDYIACFFNPAPCAAADVNGDGLTDPDDLSDFIGAYFAGC